MTAPVTPNPRAAGVTWRRRSTLRFVDQLVGNHPHPVGEVYEAGQVEGQFGPVAATPIGQIDPHEHLAIVVDPRAYLEFALRIDSHRSGQRFLLALGLDTLSVTEAGARRKPHPGGGAA